MGIERRIGTKIRSVIFILTNEPSILTTNLNQSLILMQDFIDKWWRMIMRESVLCYPWYSQPKFIKLPYYQYNSNTHWFEQSRAKNLTLHSTTPFIKQRFFSVRAGHVKMVIAWRGQNRSERMAVEEGRWRDKLVSSPQTDDILLFGSNKHTACIIMIIYA